MNKFGKKRVCVHHLENDLIVTNIAIRKKATFNTNTLTAAVKYTNIKVIKTPGIFLIFKLTVFIINILILNFNDIICVYINNFFS